MCIDCSGIHRNLGVHISTVKSLTLDTWHQKWIDCVCRIGNRVGNDYYEHRFPANFRRPVHTDGVAAVENFIRAKYIRLEYADKSRPAPCDSPASSASSVSSRVGPEHATRCQVHRVHHPKVESHTPSVKSTDSAELIDLLDGPPVSHHIPTGQVPVQPLHSIDLFSTPQPNVVQTGCPLLEPIPQFKPPLVPIPSVSGHAPNYSAGPQVTHRIKAHPPKAAAPVGGLADIDPFALFSIKK